MVARKHDDANPKCFQGSQSVWRRRLDGRPKTARRVPGDSRHPLELMVIAHNMGICCPIDMTQTDILRFTVGFSQAPSRPARTMRQTMADTPLVKIAPNNPIFDLPVLVGIEEGLFKK